MDNLQIDLTSNKPLVMGILNITPDSFYDGGQRSTIPQYLKHCERMLIEGADIIDIGAISTRSGADELDFNQELARLLPIVKSIKQEFPSAYISIDTWRSEIARTLHQEGINMINDISGGLFDSLMKPTIKECHLAYVMMHIQGRPGNMQQSPSYINVVQEVFSYLKEEADQLRKETDIPIILDPGFGFGKSIEHNYKLMNSLDLLTNSGYPVLVGISRKSMIYKLLDITPNEALNGTTVLNTMALMKGAKILRVHDVKEAKECAQLISKLKHA